MVNFPPESPLGDIEESLVDEAPAEFWPQNQDSVVGELRHSLALPLQGALDGLQTLENEAFAETSTLYLDGWEEEVGLPVTASGATVDDRRAAISSRLRTGPFSIDRLETLTERFISATFGTSASFGTQGIALVSSGIPLYGDATSVTDSYRIYEDMMNEQYYVYIVSGLVPNAAIQRELKWITPAGITLNYDNSHVNILWYQKLIVGDGPLALWRLDEPSGTTANDSSGLTYNGTYNGGFTLNQSPLVHGTNDIGASVKFNGSSGYVEIADNAALRLSNSYSCTCEAWINTSVMPTTNTSSVIVQKWLSYGLKITNTAGSNKAVFGVYLSDGWHEVSSTTEILPLFPYHVSGVFDGISLKIYINGKLDATSVISGYILGSASYTIRIGAASNALGSYFNGYIDEVAVYSQPLNSTQVLSHYTDGGSAYASLIASGNEITDAVRLAGLSGDGKAYPDSSYGVWPLATNICKNGTAATNLTGWSASAMTTFARSNTWSKFAGWSIHCIGSATNNDWDLFYTTDAGTFAAGDSISVSLWVNVISTPTNNVRFLIRFYDNVGALISTSVASNIAVGTGVQKLFTQGLTCPANTDHIDIRILQSQPTTFGSGEFYVSGLMIEGNSICTPYVHTVSATASRGQGQLSAPSGLLNKTQGWFAAKISTGFNATDPFGGSFVTLAEWADDNNNRILLRYNPADDTWKMTRNSAGAGNTASSAAQTFTTGVTKCIVGYWTGTTVAISVDGAAFVTAANSSIPSLVSTSFEIGAHGSALQICSELKWFACGKGVLTNSDATLFNSFSTDPNISDFPSTTLVTGIAKFDDARLIVNI